MSHVDCGLFEAIPLKVARARRFYHGDEVGVGPFTSLWVRAEARIPCFWGLCLAWNEQTTICGGNLGVWDPRLPLWAA